MSIGYGWGTVGASAPAPFGAAAPPPGGMRRATALFRDAVLIAAGFGVLALGQRLLIPEWSYGYETPLLWSAVCLVGATLGLARGTLAAVAWATYELLGPRLLYRDILLNFAEGPRLPGRFRAPVRNAWEDWGHLSAIAGVVVAVGIIGLACDLALDRQPVVGAGVMVGAVGVGKLIGAAGFAVGLGLEAGAKARGAWSVSLWMILGTYGPVLLAGAVVTAGVAAGIRFARPNEPPAGRD